MKKLTLFFALIILSCNTKSVSTLADENSSTVDTPVIAEPKVVSIKNDKKAKELSFLFRIKNDEFENVKWITPKSAPTYTNYNALYCYFSISNNNPNNLRFRLQYVSNDWLFIESEKFLIDGQVFDYFPSEVKRDNGDGEIWEWWDENVSSTDLVMLQAIRNSKTAKIKLSGSQYHKVVDITEKQKLNIGKCLDYFEALGGIVE